MRRALLAAATIASALSCGGAVESGDDPSADQRDSGVVGTVSGRLTFSDRLPSGQLVSGPLTTTVVLLPLQRATPTLHRPAPLPAPSVVRAESGASGDYLLSAPPGLYTFAVNYKGAWEPLSTSPQGWNAVRIEAGSALVRDELIDYKAE